MSKKSKIDPDEEAFINSFIRAENRAKACFMSFKGKGKRNCLARQIRNSGELINVGKMWKYAVRGY